MTKKERTPKPAQPATTQLDVKVNVGTALGSSRVTGAEVSTSGPVNVQADTVILQQTAAPSTPRPERPARGEIPPEGALPPGYRMPYHRNELFTGRMDDLLALADTLLYGAYPGQVVAAGMGGLGKTQLAVEFCWRFGTYFDSVHWIAADQDLGVEVAACGQAMGVAPWPERLDEQVTATLRAWQSGGLRLVVLDNVSDENIIATWLPRLTGLSVLITSRQEEWPEDLGLQVLSLGRFSRPESLALLRRICRRLARTGDDQLDALAERLGDLPLALDLAARYLKDVDDLSLPVYLDELNEAVGVLEHDSLLDWTEHSPTRHATSLGATFRMSWQKLETDADLDILARRLYLTFSGCAANIPVPIALLEAAQTHSKLANRRDVRRALKKLSALGLASQQEGGLVLHRLLSDFARALDTRQNRTGLTSLCEALVIQCAAANQSGLPADFEPIRPHVETAVVQAEEKGLPQTPLLWNELGNHYAHAGHYQRAKAPFEQAYKLYKRMMGEKNPATITCLANQGVLASRMGDHAGALVLLEQALKRRREVLGERHPETAATWNNLGGVRQQMGDLDAAQACFEKAIEIRRGATGGGQLATAMTLNNLGLLLREKGDLSGARRYLDEALEIFRQERGGQHPDTATALNNLGNLLIRDGDLAGARPYYEEALAITQAVLGQEHPDTAGSLNNLGMLLYRLDDYAGARPYLEQALAILRKNPGEKHPDTLLCQSNLGTVIFRQGDLTGARAIFERLIPLARQLLGGRHTSVATYLNNMALVLQSQRELQDARTCLVEAVSILEERLGAGHERTVGVRRRLERLTEMLRERP